MKKINLSQFISRNKKKVALFAILVVFGTFCLVSTSHAENVDQGAIVGGLASFASWAFEKLIAITLQLITFLFQFFLNLAKYNNYIEAPVVQVGWILVRDVANMFFVVILLAIAFGTILGLENYQWNKLLGKLIFAAIFINFSNTICGLFIDIAYVFSLTFLNAIANTAGANFINTVHMDKLNNLEMGSSEKAEDMVAIAVSSMVAFIFSAILLLTIGAYTIIMLFRMIVLWLLIILSPLAFIMQVMPQTQEYAKQWWGKFTKQVLVLPVMVFFIWLTLATMSGGTVADDLSVGFKDSAIMNVNPTIMQITKFDNLANFFVPIAMLVVGITLVGQMGVVGGGLAGKALDFGKKVATIATGYALGRKLVGGAVSGIAKGGKNLAKGAYMNLPVVGGRSMIRVGKRLDDFRRENKFVKHIPLIGGARDEYNEKLDKRLEKQLAWKKETRINALSDENNMGWFDKAGKKVMEKTGGKMGWGLKYSSARKNKAEEENQRSMEQKKAKADSRSSYGAARLDGYATQIADKFQEGEGSLTDEDREKSVDKAFKEWSLNANNKDKSMEDFMAEGGEVKAEETRYKDFLEKIKKDKSLTAGMTDVNGQALDESGRVAVANAARNIYHSTRSNTNKAKADEARKEAMKSVAQINFGKIIVEQEGAAKIGAEMADNFLKGTKDAAVDLKWKKAKEELEKIKGLEPQERDLALQNALNGTTSDARFIQAAYYKEEADAQEKETKASREGATQSLNEIQDEKFAKFYAAKRDIAKAEQDDEYIKQVQSGNVVAPELKLVEIKELTLEEQTQYEELISRLKESVEEGITREEALKKLEPKDRELIERKDGNERNKILNASKQAEYKRAKAKYDTAQGGEANNVETLKEDSYYASVASGEINESNMGAMTPRMRAAQAEVLSKATENYFNSVKRKAPQYTKAADGLASFREQVESVDGEIENLGDEEKYTPEQKIQRASLNEKKAQMLAQQKEYLEKDPFAAEVYYEQQAKVAENEVSSARSQATMEMAMTGLGEALIGRLADAEIGAKMADEYVKGVKNAHLSEEYEEAADKMKKWAEMDMEQAREESGKAIKNRKENIYVKVLGLTKKVAEEEQITTVRRKQAEDAAYDAFVVKPLYGTTSPSSAMSELAESKMKGYSGLDRAAMAKKATDMQAAMLKLQKDGKVLTLQQQAELEAASSVLQKEAWNDDQAGYMFKMFQKLEKKELVGDEKATWENMADVYSQLGWLTVDRDEKGGMKRDENKNIIMRDVAKNSGYKRKYAADLQAVNMTGGDTGLIGFHNLVNDEKEKLARQRDAKSADTRAEELQKILDRVLTPTGPLTEEDEKIRGAYDKAVEGFISKNGTKLKKAGKSQGEIDEAAKEAGVEAVESVDFVSQELEKSVSLATKDLQKSYWEIAESLQDQAGMTVVEMKKRYEGLMDFMQVATKNNKHNALETGHVELGYNQDFDEDIGIYRFQTSDEAKTKMRKERSKRKTRQLIDGDQIHSYGDYDLLTGTLSNIDEEIIAGNVGGATKKLDLTSMPLRSKKGLVLMAEDETVQTTIGRGGQTLGVYGGQKNRESLEAKGITTKQARAEFMMIHDLLPTVLGGKEGFGFLASDLYKIIDEKGAREGKLAISVEGVYELDTVNDATTEMIGLITKNSGILAGTAYEGRGKEVIKRLKQLQTSFVVGSVVDPDGDNSGQSVSSPKRNKPRPRRNKSQELNPPAEENSDEEIIEEETN